MLLLNFFHLYLKLNFVVSNYTKVGTLATHAKELLRFFQTL